MTTAIFNNGGLYNNGKVAICKDLMFGLCVWDGVSWLPLTKLDKEDLDLVKSLIDNDPLFLWWDYFPK